MIQRGGHVMVIGGGVIGLACAHYLSLAGYRVTVIDRDKIGDGCSLQNCGLISPSHVLPLAGPGEVGNAIRMMLSRSAPLRVKLRFDPALWRWLWRFARRCNHRDAMEGASALKPLLESSRAMYTTLIESESLDCEWRARGLLFVYKSPKAMNKYVAIDRMMRDEFDISARRFEGEELLELEPALKPGLAGGWLHEEDAHLRPEKLLSSWRSRLEDRGVLFREDCEMMGWERTEAVATAVRSNQGELTADAFVVATGAWTPFLARHLGCPIPIQPGKGYSITMPRPSICPSIPMLFPEHRVAVTPMDSGYRLGSIMEFAGYDKTIRPSRLRLLTDGASHYLREPTCEPIEHRWYGWRPMTYDSLPIIDRSPELSNVFIAAGHCMLGLSAAPATGRLVSELIAGETPHIDPTPYSVKRF